MINIHKELNPGLDSKSHTTSSTAIKEDSKIFYKIKSHIRDYIIIFIWGIKINEIIDEI